MSNHVFIIAEAGVNHNGDIGLAKQLVDAAAEAGADAVKFQTFVTEKLVTRSAKQAQYQINNLGKEESQFEMLKKLELTPKMHSILIERCLQRKIKFMSTAFDDTSINLLRSIGSTPWKIPSGEITNLPYIRRIGSFGEEVILSTGMATLGEIEEAINVLEKAGTSQEKISLLHCTTDYPTQFEEVNLLAMKTIGNAFQMKYGYSDHTSGIEVSIAAVALGAVIIEKHFTLDKFLPGPDHKASLNPSELGLLVSSIRHIEQALGNGIKRPTPNELCNIVSSRKSIVASKAICAGETFSEDKITTKRPGNGISPMRWDQIIGKIAHRDFKQDEAIDF